MFLGFFFASISSSCSRSIYVFWQATLSWAAGGVGRAQKEEIRKGKCRISNSSGGAAVLAEYDRLINTAVNINEFLADDQWIADGRCEGVIFRWQQLGYTVL
jgi:hypothetical protein